MSRVCFITPKNLETMQQVSPAFQLVLDARRRNLSTVIEFYDPGYLPDIVTGFNPADAVKRYARTRLTHFGNVYERRLKSIGRASRFISGKANNLTIKMSNVSRDYAAFILNNKIEGMWCVERRLCRSLDDPGEILFVGKFEKPDDTSKTEGSLTAKQIGSGIDYKLPPRTFRSEDSQGRALGDPLHDGFPYIPINGNFVYTTLSEGSLFKGRKVTWHTVPWSSASGTPLGDPIPEILCGRAQLSGIPVEFADTGTTIYARHVLANGKLAAIEDVRKRTNGFSELMALHIHLGEPGGTGTQTIDGNFPATGLLSGTAYYSFNVTGSAPDVVDESPITTAVGFAEMPLPDAAGDFTLLGPSDNPVYGARNLQTKPDYYNLPPELIDDAHNALEAEYCNEPLIDDAQTERAILPSGIFPLTVDGRVRRFSSSGALRLQTYRKLLDLDVDGELLIDAILGTIDDGDPFDLGPPVRVYRKRFTANLVVSGESQATDVLHKVLAPAARLYFLTSAKGLLQTNVEKPADSVLLTSATSIGATVLPVDSVKRWIGNLRGFALVGVGRDEWQRVTIDGAPEGGTFTLDGSAEIPYNPVASDVQNALEGIYGAENVKVDGPANGPFDVFFTGDLGGQPRALMVATESFSGGTSPGITVETIEEGTDGTHSEVRKVSGVIYGTAGNAVTLDADVTGGGVTATASGATLSGADDDTPASGTVTIGGSPSAGDTVTVTIDGVEILLTLDALDTTGTVAAQLRDAIAADPDLRRYTTATWSIDTPNVVTITALLGALQLAPPYPGAAAALEYAHAVSEETIRIMMPFSDRASLQSGCARQNILPGTFKFKENKEKTVNQVKGEFIDSRNDFAKTPYVLNDTPDQTRTRKVVAHEIDMTAIDNVHQASRIARGAFSKFVEGARFFGWSAGYAANVLEEGDVVCVSEGSGGFINIPVRIEDLGLEADGKTLIDSRIYSTRMFSDYVGPHAIPLPTGLRERLAENVLPLALTGGTYTLSVTEAAYDTIRLTGTLTSNLIIEIPANRAITFDDELVRAGFTVTINPV